MSSILFFPKLSLIPLGVGSERKLYTKTEKWRINSNDYFFFPEKTSDAPCSFSPFVDCWPASTQAAAAPSTPRSFIVHHDAIRYGTFLWPVWAMCPSSVLSQLLLLPLQARQVRFSLGIRKRYFIRGCSGTEKGIPGQWVRHQTARVKGTFGQHTQT